MDALRATADAEATRIVSRNPEWRYGYLSLRHVHGKWVEYVEPLGMWRPYHSNGRPHGGYFTNATVAIQHMGFTLA